MTSNNYSLNVRTSIYDVVGPLGWSIAWMAEAASCSAATVVKDLRSRGGTTDAFPNRPTRDESYAATFLYYTRGSFPNDHVRSVFERLLDIARIVTVTAGMERALIALKTPLHTPEYARYFALLERIFEQRGKTNIDLSWRCTQYMKNVKEGVVPPPSSVETALQGVAELIRHSPDRAEIFLPVPPGLPEAMSKALNLLHEHGERVIVSLYGLGDREYTVKEIAQGMGESQAYIRNIEEQAIQDLRDDPRISDRLRPFMRNINDCLKGEERLRQTNEALRVELATLRGGNADDHIRHLSRSIYDEVELRPRTANTLINAGIEDVRQLVARREHDLLGIRGFGPVSLTEVKALLATFGLSLGMDPPSQPDHTSSSHSM